MKKAIIYFIIIFSILIPYKSLSNNDEANISKIFSLSSDLEIGDEVLFGNYFDYDNNGELFFPLIKWIVLDKSEFDYLLITKNIIDTKKYSLTKRSVTWEDSYIRNFLNNEFYDVAFNEFEKDQIYEEYTINLDHRKYKTPGGNLTKDKVFLLSIDEIKKYFVDNFTFKCSGTKYAIKNGLWTSQYDILEKHSVWWLRSPGIKSNYAALIYDTGAIGDDGDPVETFGNGVRPSIRVKYNRG